MAEADEFTIEFLLYVATTIAVRVNRAMYEGQGSVEHSEVEPDDTVRIRDIRVIDGKDDFGDDNVVAEYTRDKFIDPKHVDQILAAAELTEITIPRLSDGRYYVR